MTLRSGWIGCGVHADATLSPRLARLPVHRSVPAERITRDWRGLLARDDPDAVAAGPALRAEIGLAALARRLADAAAGSGVPWSRAPRRASARPTGSPPTSRTIRASARALRSSALT